MLEIHGTSALSDFLDDFVIYRRLEPADPRLPGLPALWPALGWSDYRIPRKSETAYAEVVAHILREARKLDAPGKEIRHLLYIGDTRMNDGTAFANLCQAGDWHGLAFICDEKPDEPPTMQHDGRIALSNRWSALGRFLHDATEAGIALDVGTVVVVDMDKTAVGARGRNDKVIDRTRVQAVHETVAGLLGDRFRPAAFGQAYDTLNQPAYHPFTGDNQDILAYLCLVIGSGITDLAAVIDGYRLREIPSFDAFIRSLESRRADLDDAGLLSIHDDVLRAWLAGDPTPFKAFRYREYVATAARFDPSPSTLPLEVLLAERIAITEEVRQVARHLRERGALLFGLSDKPDEASCPDAQRSAQGLNPLHRCLTLAVGEALQI